MDQYDQVLKKQEKRHASSLLKKHGIICKQLAFGKADCPPLYVAKPHWTNRFDDDRESTIGVFCAVWVSPTLLKKNQFAYNIHAKTLQKLPGYKLKPKEFANEFRSLVKSQVAQWPGIKLDYGPSTLLQGVGSSDLDSFSESVEERIAGFVEIHQHIDALLENGLA